MERLSGSVESRPRGSSFSGMKGTTHLGWPSTPTLSRGSTAAEHPHSAAETGPAGEQASRQNHGESRGARHTTGNAVRNNTEQNWASQAAHFPLRQPRHQQPLEAEWLPVVSPR